MHDIGSLLVNCESLWTEWKTGKEFSNKPPASNGGRFSSSSDTSWMDDVDPSLFGVTEAEWRNA